MPGECITKIGIISLLDLLFFSQSKPQIYAYFQHSLQRQREKCAKDLILTITDHRSHSRRSTPKNIVLEAL